MGQKVHPGGMRVGVIHDWKSNWYTGNKDFADFLQEDVRIRVSQQPLVVRDLDAADHELAARDQLVDVEALADPHIGTRPFSLRITSAIAMSSANVTLMFVFSPSTSRGV